MYFYLPSQNKGTIKINEVDQNEKDKKEINNNLKNVFTNTEFITQDKNGQTNITRAKESYTAQNQPDLINLSQVYSFTKLKKDQSLIEINSDKGFYNKKNKEIKYEGSVKIKNKHYLIEANSAEHLFFDNLIIINGNVIMKDINDEIRHVIYCDTVEINTITNNAVAFMQNKNTKVISKKFK